MNCYAFLLIQKEVLHFKTMLQHEESLTQMNVSSLASTKMEIEAMLKRGE